MAYKQTQAVRKIYDDIDKYLAALHPRKPSCIRLKREHYIKLTEDENKRRMDRQEQTTGILPPYRGLEVVLHDD